MRELTFHQAADAVRAGKDILLATRFTKSLVNTAFFDAERYFIEEPNEQLKNPSQELKKSTQEPKKTGAEPIIPSSEYDIIMESRRAGETYDQIGARYGCTGATVKNFLVREGKKRAQKGEQQ